MRVMSHKVIHGKDEQLFTINCRGTPAAFVEKERKSKEKNLWSTSRSIPKPPWLWLSCLLNARFSVTRLYDQWTDSAVPLYLLGVSATSRQLYTWPYNDTFLGINFKLPNPMEKQVIVCSTIDSIFHDYLKGF